MGIGRIRYFLKKVALFLNYTIVVFLSISLSHLSWAMSIFFIIVSIITAYLNYRLLKSRLINMGFDSSKTWLWLLLDFVPLLNLFLLFFMSLYPTHERKH